MEIKGSRLRRKAMIGGMDNYRFAENYRIVLRLSPLRSILWSQNVANKKKDVVVDLQK